MTRNARGSVPQTNPATAATVAQRLTSTQGDTGLAEFAVGQLGHVGDRKTPSEVRLQASALAHRRWGKCEDRTAATAPGRTAFEQRFLDEADGDPQRADSLRKSYYANLARQGVEARRRNRLARENGAA